MSSERKARIKDVVGTVITGLIGTVVVLCLEYVFYQYQVRDDVSLVVSNSVASIINTVILNRWYSKAFSVKRLVFNLSCTLVSVGIGRGLGNIIDLSSIIEDMILRNLVLQCMIGMIQFVIGLIVNIVSYRKLGKLDRK